MFILCSADLDGTDVSTLESSGVTPQMQRLLLAAAGNYRAEFVALLREVVRANIVTRDIEALTAVKLGSGSVTYRGVDEGGVGSSTYKTVKGTDGATLIVPRTISWAAGGVATLAVDMFFLSSDGVQAPVTVASTAGDLTAEADVWVGAGDLVNSIRIDFGYEIVMPEDGYLYPQHSFIRSQRPVISYVAQDEGELTTANLNPGSISTLTVRLAKIADGGVRGAQKTYSLTGHVHVDQVQGAKPGTVSVTCVGKGGITIS